MAAYDIKQHFKGLRVDAGKRKGRRDPFATGFEDDSDEEEQRRSRSTTTTRAPPVEKAVAPAKPTVNSVASPFAQLDASLRDSDDELLDAWEKPTDRGPSPGPTNLHFSRVLDQGKRRGSLPGRSTRGAVALAAGDLAYLDDSEDDDALTAPRRTDRRPSPAPRKDSDPTNPSERSSTPRGSREPPKEQSQTRLQPSRHTVASPFAGTKYLEDSDTSDDEEAISSRQASTDSNSTSPPPTEPDALSPYESSFAPKQPDIKRVDKPKQNGSGISWRAFSASRHEQRNAEFEAIQAKLRQRGKSISFGTHAVTDDGKKVPIAQSTAEEIFISNAGGRGRARGRGKSPPRRAEDFQPAEDELREREEERDVGNYDAGEFKSNAFSGVYGRI